MITIRNIEVKKENNYLVTIGLKPVIGAELKLLLYDRDINEYLKVSTYLIDYFVDYKPAIKDGETIGYHSWILKFVISGDHFNLFEAKPNGDDYMEGVDFAISVVVAQEEECSIRDVTAIFPLFSQMLAVSKGVLEGEMIDAVRYPSPDQMTGWWLTTELYDGNIESIQVIHYHHLAFKRPDIVKYMALPFGFRFQSGGANEVWFDENVLSS